MKQRGDEQGGTFLGRRAGRLGDVGSWLLVGLSCALLAVYLILHTREVGLILAWLRPS